MTIVSTVANGQARLIDAGIPPEAARIDAEVLARHVLGWDRATYVSECHRPVDRAFDTRYAALITRRVGREPVAHLVGYREFWGLELAVTPDVLIPRPETELVVETALRLWSARPGDFLLADVGTGSGCLAIALATEFPAARVIATDMSAAALDVAQANAARHGVADRITWYHGRDLAGAPRPVDLIVSNPPYVPAAAIDALAPEVRDHEPRIALNGGPDGTVALRAVIADADGALAPDGDLIVEFGSDQESAFREIVAGTGLRVTRVARDLQGLARVGVAARRRSS